MKFFLLSLLKKIYVSNILQLPNLDTYQKLFINKLVDVLLVIVYAFIYASILRYFWLFRR